MKWFFKCFLASIIVTWVIGGTPIYATTYTYTPIDYPGSIATAPMDINNNGFIVGEYAPERGVGKAFIYDGSCYQTIAIQDAVWSRARGINDY